MLDKIKHAFAPRKVIIFCFDIMCYLMVCAVIAIISEHISHLYPLFSHFVNVAIILCVLTSISRAFVFRIYNNVWRYSNSYSYLIIVAADISACICTIPLSILLKTYCGIWPVVVVAAGFNIVTLCSRFVYQLMYKHLNEKESRTENNKINVAIVGAGQLGVLLAEELILKSTSHYTPYCFIDTDTDKVGSKIRGLKVYYEDESIIDTIKDLPVQEILIALPRIDNERALALYEFYSRTGCKVKLYDTAVQDISSPSSSRGTRRSIREFQIEDLLFRRSIEVSSPESRAYYRNKVVLVTGGGGSIGSELCRQIAKCQPKQLIILDIYENNAYDIQQELWREYGVSLDFRVEIASVRDRVRLDAIFNHYRPQIVFHAAAHKHVPLMEHSNSEAIKNNVMGTYNTADMAEKYGVAKFILISTDKAVNPTNVMGASKRMCEMVVQCRTDSKTSFAAVRFGNVLGSNGSVIPLFKKQIAKGGPLTVTDKRIIRYFMTIPEASQLVMHAGSMAKRGELFVLDMGKPVKIYDLAVNMIKLSGLRPDIDIEIVETGLRPGEKLYEELLIKTEKLQKTSNNLIFIESDAPLSREEVEDKIAILNRAVEAAEGELESVGVKEALMEVVPTFHNPEDVNCNAEDSAEMKITNAVV